jgi:gluconate 2-dehydrogenase gamma chain
MLPIATRTKQKQGTLPMDETRHYPPARRRDFLRATGAAFGTSWLMANLPLFASTAVAARQAQAAGKGFVHLAAEEAADLEAIAARIVPTDETPGAREAGVIWFIDLALGGFVASKAGVLREGLASLNRAVAAAHGKPRFASLAPREQDQVLATVDTTPFFEDIRLLTLAGLLTLPEYGGNRDHLGWKLIGFEHRHAWTPPFGYYDAEATREGGTHG